MDEEKETAAGPMCSRCLYPLPHNRDMTPSQCQTAGFLWYSAARELLFIDWYNFPDVRSRALSANFSWNGHQSLSLTEWCLIKTLLKYLAETCTDAIW